MNSRPIMWDSEPGSLAADPVATLARDRSAWEGLGAIFHDVDDGQGETPGLATGTIHVAGDSVPVGIVDYGETSTYLLVQGAESVREARTKAVLESLEASGAIRLETDLLDLAGGRAVSTLEERVAEVERRLANLELPQAVPAWPVAEPRSGHVASTPPGTKHFGLQFPGISARFQDVRGVSVLLPPSTPPGAQHPMRQLIATSVEYGAVTKRSNADADLGLDKWIAEVADKGLEGTMKDGSLTLFGAADEPLATWSLTKAVITGLTVNTIGVERGEPLDVQATFAVEKIERKEARAPSKPASDRSSAHGKQP